MVLHYRLKVCFIALVIIVTLRSVSIQQRELPAFDDARDSKSVAEHPSSLHVVVVPHAASSCSLMVNCGACVQSTKCVWCATEQLCVDDALTAPCPDLESQSRGCSAIFLFPIPAYHRVIYVGKRSGGPEALVQLHLALLHWGFNSSLETRKRQVGKSLLPFFRETYGKEFARLGVRMSKSVDYRKFLSTATSEDLLILTETWPCQRGIRFDRGSGARQLQYHLTIQDRKFTYDVSHMYIPDADPEECNVFTHTHFMTTRFLNQSLKATLIPYVSPHIVEAADRFLLAPSESEPMLLKRTVILYDGDAGFDPSQVNAVHRGALVKAASIKPHVLYKMFTQTLCVIDFGMPGAERLVLESSLFGAVVIINDELNGIDRVDFPVPERYRLRGRNYSHLNVLLDDLVNARDSGALQDVVAEFEPLRSLVRRQRTEFYRSVRRYFSDSAHFTLEISSSIPSDVIPLIAAILVHAPLSTISVCFPTRADAETFVARHKNFVEFLSRFYLRSSVSFVAVGDLRVPHQALLRFIWKHPSCFPSSYDFVSVVATAYYHHHHPSSNEDDVRYSQVSVRDCFDVSLHNVSLEHQSSTHHASMYLNHSIVRSLGDLHKVSRVVKDPLWIMFARERLL
jgi:hypothetical protein